MNVILSLDVIWKGRTPPEPEVESSPVSAKGSNFCRFWIAELATPSLATRLNSENACNCIAR
jgi:hypothetical protein